MGSSATNDRPSNVGRRQLLTPLQRRKQNEWSAITELNGHPTGGRSESLYLVHAGWIRRWTDFVTTGSAVAPGPIRNDLLFYRNGFAKPGLKPAIDYRAVNVKVWCVLRRAYGGGPEVRRPVVDIYSRNRCVPTDAENASHSKRSAAPSCQNQELSCGHWTCRWSHVLPLRTPSEPGRQLADTTPTAPFE